jgi:hypothetical protein
MMSPTFKPDASSGSWARHYARLSGTPIFSASSGGNRR